MRMRRWLVAGIVGVVIGVGAAVAAPEPGPAGPARKAEPRELPEKRVNPKDGAEMILVPAGSYLRCNLFVPQPRRERLPAYYIYRNLVTVAQYRTYCKATGRVMPAQPDWSDVATLIPQEWLRGDAHAPVTGIPWSDAVAYCTWAGVLLPTDGQWEKAAWGRVGPNPPADSPHGVHDLRVVPQQWCRFDPDLENRPVAGKPRNPDTHSIRGAYGPFDPNPWEHSSLGQAQNGNAFRGVLEL